MITDSDIKKLSKTFVTKDEFKKLAKEVETNNLITAQSFADITKELHDTRDDLKNDIKKLNDKTNIALEKISNTLDFMLGEIRNLQTDNIVISSWKRLITDHEDRITKLEKSHSAN